MKGRANRLAEGLLIGVPLLLAVMFGLLTAAGEEAMAGLYAGDVIGFGYLAIVSVAILCLALRRRRRA